MNFQSGFPEISLVSRFPIRFQACARIRIGFLPGAICEQAQMPQDRRRENTIMEIKIYSMPFGANFEPHLSPSVSRPAVPCASWYQLECFRAMCDSP